MKTIDLSSKDKTKVFIASILVLIFAQLTSMAGQWTASWINCHSAFDNLQQRISLDIGFVDVGNDTLNTPVNPSAVTRYIKRLNAALAERNYPLAIVSLQNVSSEDIPAAFTQRTTLNLRTSEQNISLTIASLPHSAAIQFSPIAFIMGLLFAPIYALFIRTEQKQSAQVTEVVSAPPRLVINLQTKTLSCNVNEHEVTLQNKPLCFYTALLKFCIVEPNAPLQLHKDVPPDLVALANKTFSRLIELGHTKRKRPDFNANLDKTLSEIRAALDEVFSGIDSEKERYYPPRAQGEGSRSKQHSYSLQHLEEHHIEIIGS